MADRVIVVGTKRGRINVSATEIRQMCGRAGRTHGEDACADIIVEQERASRFDDELRSAEAMTVNSSLSSIPQVAFHVLPEICAGRIRNNQTFDKWYSTTFSYYQGGDCNSLAVFEYLESCNAVTVGDFVVASESGRIASQLYIRPEDLAAWRDNFDTLFSCGLEDNTVASCWALGNVPYKKVSGTLPSYQIRDAYMGECPSVCRATDGSILTPILWWYLMDGPPVGSLRNVAVSFKEDFGRIHRALIMLDAKVGKWGKQEYFDGLKTMVDYRVGRELIPLCKLRGIGKTRGLYLYNMGVVDLESLRENHISLKGEVDERFWKVIQDLV